MAQGHKVCKIDWLWVRSSLEDMEYLFTFIFSFLRSGVEAKHGVEFCHSTCNASRTSWKVGNGVRTLGSLCLLIFECGIQREADDIKRLL